MSDNDWRSRYRILVPEANALGAIAVIRSLGRAGYKVHACASDRDALGLRSRFASEASISPSYSSPEYVPWLRTCIEKYGIAMIVPSEGFLHAISACYGEFRRYMHLPADAAIVYRAFSKIDVAETLLAGPQVLGFRPHSPPTFVLRRSEALPARVELERLPLPVYLKSDAQYCRTGAEPFFKRITRHADVQPEVSKAFETYDAVLVQGHVPGMKAAAAFCLWKNEVIARSEVLGLRTTPYTGGMMSLRVTTRNEPLAAHALHWLRHLEWEGVAMVECKYDRTTENFWFIELNPRYWGYLHLDLFSGVDVPRIQADHFFGNGEEILPRQKLGVAARHTVPGDAGHLLSVLKDSQLPVGPKLAAVVRFCFDFLNPVLNSDLLFKGDRFLYWRQWHRYLKDNLMSLRRKQKA